MIKQKELSVLLINRLNLPDCGSYAIEVMGKNTRHIASLNVEC